MTSYYSYMLHGIFILLKNICFKEYKLFALFIIYIYSLKSLLNMSSAILLHFLDWFEWLFWVLFLLSSVRWQSNRGKNFPSNSTTCKSNWVSNTCLVKYTEAWFLCPFPKLTERKLSSWLFGYSCHLVGVFIQSDLKNTNCRESLCEKPWNNCFAQGHNPDKIGLSECLVSGSHLLEIVECFFFFLTDNLPKLYLEARISLKLEIALFLAFTQIFFRKCKILVIYVLFFCLC